MKNYKILFFLFFILCISEINSQKLDIKEKNFSGFFDFSYIESSDKILLKVNKINQDFL
jgi:hypothetical protein